MLVNSASPTKLHMGHSRTSVLGSDKVVLERIKWGDAGVQGGSGPATCMPHFLIICSEPGGRPVRDAASSSSSSCERFPAEIAQRGAGDLSAWSLSPADPHAQASCRKGKAAGSYNHLGWKHP